MESRSLPITLRPNFSDDIPKALICLAVCAFILVTWGNGSTLTALIGLLLFGTIPVNVAMNSLNAEEIFLRLDESGFTISRAGHQETVQWDWVESFMVVKGTKHRRWIGWRYAAHYPPLHRRQRSTRYRVADEVLPSHYGMHYQTLVDLLNQLHAEYRSSAPQQKILRPQLAQMLSDAVQLPMTLYPDQKTLTSAMATLAVIGAITCYFLSNHPITLTVILAIFALVAIRFTQETNNGITYLRLDEEGFTHHTPQTEKFVRWDEVEHFLVPDHSEFVGWKYVPGSADKRKNVLAFQASNIDDVLTRVYGDRPEDLVSLLNHVRSVQTAKLSSR